MLKSSLCDYSDVYIFVKGMITFVGQVVDAAPEAADGRNKHKIFKNCAPLLIV